MNTKGIYRKTLILLVLVFLNWGSTIAQPGLPNDGPNDPNPVPITGIEYLLAAGAAFGAKKLFDKRKSNSK